MFYVQLSFYRLINLTNCYKQYFWKKKNQFRRLNEIYLMDDVASCTNITQFSLIIWVMYVCLYLIWKRLIFFIWNNGM